MNSVSPIHLLLSLLSQKSLPSIFAFHRRHQFPTHPGFGSNVKPNIRKMNRCAYQQRALVGGCVGVADINLSVSDVVVCPKPRRIGILDTILTKGYDDMETPNFEMASSPPFFFGSPPSRASNPLIQDSQFGNHNFVPVLAIPEQAVVAAPPSPPPPSLFNPVSAYGGGCVPMKFGNKPAAVRIEGFNCRNSISAVA